jgi:predicted NUDIX family NTP pyrophosphohydrolase
MFQSLGFAVGPVKEDKGKASIMYVLGSPCDSGPSYSSKFEFECDPKSGQVRQLQSGY